MLNCIDPNTKFITKLILVHNFSKSRIFIYLYSKSIFCVLNLKALMSSRYSTSISVFRLKYIEIGKNLYMREKNERKNLDLNVNLNSVSSF